MKAWIMGPGIAFVLVGVVGLAGCVGGAVENSFTDADERFTNSFTGGHERTHTFDVPSGADEVRVALHYEVSGGFTAQLIAPTGMVQQVNEGGVADQKDDAWYSTSGPASGQWRIQVSAGGTGAYALGVYVS